MQLVVFFATFAGISSSQAIHSFKTTNSKNSFYESFQCYRQIGPAQEQDPCQWDAPHHVEGEFRLPKREVNRLLLRCGALGQEEPNGETQFRQFGEDQQNHHGIQDKNHQPEIAV